MSGPLDFLALEKSVAALEVDVSGGLDRIETLENKIEHSDVTVNAALSQVVSGLGETIVDVNRRLDLIEADVIDRAEETHRRITALVNNTDEKIGNLKSQIQVLTDRVAASNSQWGELYDRVGRFESRADELIDLCDGDAKLGAQLKQRIDDLESSNLIAVQVAEGHTGSMVLLEKLSEKRFTTSVELVDALRKDAGL